MRKREGEMGRRGGCHMKEKVGANVFKTVVLTVAGGSRRKDKNEEGAKP
jgi:uncharacterized protein Veg